MNEDAHPVGHYEAYPEVTWDLAEERWLGTRGRSDVLIAYCRSCGWQSEGEQVAAKPERQRIAEFITGSQHWYQCPGEPEVEFRWVVAGLRDFTGGPARCRVYHRTESGPFVQLNRPPAPRRAVLSFWADDREYAYIRELTPRGQVIYKKLIVRGFPAARALAFARMAQKANRGRRQ
jgi:hypothetical protein